MDKVYIGKLFGRYNVNFPVNEDLVIIIGRNGSGKTKCLELLVDYFINKKENLLYFDTERKFNIDKERIESVFTYLKLQKNILDVDVNLNELNYFFNEHDYITSGNSQMINFLSSIVYGGENLIVMIDSPEISLDISKRKKFIDIIKSFSNVKKLIIVTHDPQIIGNYLDNTIEVNDMFEMFI